MLKNLLSLLLSKFYSKQESELIARQAMPLENKDILVTSDKTIVDWGKIIDYTAPTDGFINAFANKNDNATGCDISIVSGGFVNVIGSQQGGQRSVFLPMRKGASCSVWGANLKNCGVRFIYSVGGGYNILVRRAVLCLNSFSNYYLKPSLNLKKNGYLANLSLPLEATLTLIPKSTFRHVMAGLGFIEVIAPMEPASIFSHSVMYPATLSKELCFLQKKEHLDLVQQSPLKKAVRLFLTKQKELLNYGFLRLLPVNPKFNKGGALC